MRTHILVFMVQDGRTVRGLIMREKFYDAIEIDNGLRTKVVIDGHVTVLDMPITELDRLLNE